MLHITVLIFFFISRVSRCLLAIGCCGKLKLLLVLFATPVLRVFQGYRTQNTQKKNVFFFPFTMDSFSTYIDHLILILAARFQAPLEMSTEELLSPLRERSDADPWDLVSRTVQMSLCGPQTPQERLSVRHLDVQHFSAAVCRERARYMRWKLNEEQRRSRAERRSSCAAAAAHPAAPLRNAAETSNTTAAEDAPANAFDITRDSLQRDVSALYALVRQALPSTLDDAAEDEEKSDEEVEEAPWKTDEAPSGLPTRGGAATPSPLVAQVREVFVRTEEECRRDEEVARARDEFLSQIQALQTVYFNKYRRWMEVPDNVLEPPPPQQPATTLVQNSLKSSISVSGSKASTSAAAPAQHQMGSNDGLRQFSRHSDAEERAALLEALQWTQAERPAQPSLENHVATPNVRTGTHPTIATMRRQVHLQRLLRPSAVPEQALARAGPAALLRGNASSGDPVKPAMTVSAEAADRKRACAAAGAAAAAPTVNAAAKETSPPAGRHNRWQIVEYDDGDEDSN